MSENTPTIQQVLSQKRRQVFLKVLAQTGKVIEAARAVGLKSTAGLYLTRSEDEDFANAWDCAVLASADLLEEAAWDRAVHGVEEPILFKGEVVATKTNYSDTILLAMLAARKKEYRRQSQTSIDVDVNVNAKVGIAVIPMRASDDQTKDWEAHAARVHENQKALPSFTDPTSGKVIDADFTDVKEFDAKEKAAEAEKVAAQKRDGGVTLGRS